MRPSRAATPGYCEQGGRTAALILRKKELDAFLPCYILAQPCRLFTIAETAARWDLTIARQYEYENGQEETEEENSCATVDQSDLSSDFHCVSSLEAMRLRCGRYGTNPNLINLENSSDLDLCLHFQSTACQLGNRVLRRYLMASIQIMRSLVRLYLLKVTLGTGSGNSLVSMSSSRA